MIATKTIRGNNIAASKKFCQEMESCKGFIVTYGASIFLRTINAGSVMSASNIDTYVKKC